MSKAAPLNNVNSVKKLLAPFMFLITWGYWDKVKSESPKARNIPVFDLVASSVLVNILGLVLPIMMTQIYDRILPSEGTSTLVFLAIGVSIAILLDAILRMSRSYLTAWSGAVHDHALNLHLIKKMFKIPHEDFHKKSTSERLAQLQSSSKLKEFYSGQGFVALLDIPFSAIYLSAIAFIGGYMVVIPLSAIAFIGVLGWVKSRKVFTMSANVENFDITRSNIIMQTLKNVQTVKGQAMENVLMRSYEESKIKQGEEEFLLGQSQMEISSLCQAISSIALIATVALGAYLSIGGGLTVGGIAACVLLCGRAVQPAQRIIGLFDRINNARRALMSVESITNVREKKLIEIPAATGADAIGRVQLNRVCFNYEDRVDTPLFNDLTLSVKPGETIAIQGDTGSGKSTLLSLISGFYKPSKGKITLDGYQPHLIDHNTLTPGVAYLSQYPEIIHGSILDNITLFRSDSHSRQAKHVSQILGLDVAVSKLPHGYNTVIGKGQVSALPDGMLKRIAVARSLIDPTRLILFDEADAFLDPEGKIFNF